MKKLKPFRCVECGIGEVQPVATGGRTTLYKGIEVPVPADLAIRTCNNCGEEYIHASEAKAFDAALDPIYREIVREKLEAAFAALEPLQISMRRLERVLPVSEGYLSKLKKGRAEASPQIVSSLALIATSPGAIGTLEALWRASRSVKVAFTKGSIDTLKPKFTGPPLAPAKAERTPRGKRATAHK